MFIIYLFVLLFLLPESLSFPKCSKSDWRRLSLQYSCLFSNLLWQLPLKQSCYRTTPHLFSYIINNFTSIGTYPTSLSKLTHLNKGLVGSGLPCTHSICDIWMWNLKGRACVSHLLSQRSNSLIWNNGCLREKMCPLSLVEV